MAAELIYSMKRVFTDGAILQAVVWKLPVPVPGSLHAYQYRLFYGFPGRRMLGYDNERGKGDHRPVEDIEVPYAFTTPEQLIDEFLAAVQARRTL